MRCKRHGVVEKEISTEDILGWGGFSDAGLSKGLVDKALSFLEREGLAKRVRGDNARGYKVHFQQPPSKNELSFFADKEARSRMRLEKGASKRSPSGRRRQRNSPLQTTFDL